MHWSKGFSLSQGGHPYLALPPFLPRPGQPCSVDIAFPPCGDSPTSQQVASPEWAATYGLDIRTLRHAAWQRTRDSQSLGKLLASFLGTNKSLYFPPCPRSLCPSGPCTGPFPCGQQVSRKIWCQILCKVLNMDRCSWESCVIGTSRGWGTCPTSHMLHSLRAGGQAALLLQGRHCSARIPLGGSCCLSLSLSFSLLGWPLFNHGAPHPPACTPLPSWQLSFRFFSDGGPFLGHQTGFTLISVVWAATVPRRVRL